MEEFTKLIPTVPSKEKLRSCCLLCCSKVDQQRVESMCSLQVLRMEIHAMLELRARLEANMKKLQYSWHFETLNGTTLSLAYY